MDTTDPAEPEGGEVTDLLGTIDENTTPVKSEDGTSAVPSQQKTDLINNEKLPAMPSVTVTSEAQWDPSADDHVNVLALGDETDKTVQSSRPGSSVKRAAGSVRRTKSSERPGSSLHRAGSGRGRRSRSSDRPGAASSRPGTATSRPGTATSRPGTATSRPGTATSRSGTASSRPGTARSTPGSSVKGSLRASKKGASRPGTSQQSRPDTAQQSRPDTAQPSRPGTAVQQSHPSRPQTAASTGQVPVNVPDTDEEQSDLDKTKRPNTTASQQSSISTGTQRSSSAESTTSGQRRPETSATKVSDLSVTSEESEKTTDNPTKSAAAVKDNIDEEGKDNKSSYPATDVVISNKDKSLNEKADSEAMPASKRSNEKEKGNGKDNKIGKSAGEKSSAVQTPRSKTPSLPPIHRADKNKKSQKPSKAQARNAISKSREASADRSAAIQPKETGLIASKPGEIKAPKTLQPVKAHQSPGGDTIGGKTGPGPPVTPPSNNTVKQPEDITSRKTTKKQKDDLTEQSNTPIAGNGNPSTTQKPSGEKDGASLRKSATDRNTKERSLMTGSGKGDRTDKSAKDVPGTNSSNSSSKDGTSTPRPGTARPTISPDKEDTTASGEPGNPTESTSPQETGDATDSKEEEEEAWKGPRLMEMAHKGDWSLLDQTIRGLDKSHSEITRLDEDTEESLLMLSSRDNRLVITERLLELGSNINHRAKDGRAAIHFAASYAKDDMVKLLLNRKADASQLGGPLEQMALHYACSRGAGTLGMVQMLLKASGKEARLTPNKEGSLPITLAAQSGNIAVCRELLLHQAEGQVKAASKVTGNTVLHLACGKKEYDTVKLFLEAGAPVDFQNEEGHTACHLAAWEGDESIVKLLHQYKASGNITDKLDRSPLHIAAERGHTNIVELLVDKFRANVSARTKDGSTLMHIASQYGHPDTALAFLKKGVPLHMPNKGGAICLHAAATKGHVGVLKSLLQKGAHVDTRTKDNYTALHLAVQHCKPLVVQILLGFGAQVELKGGKAKETPLHIAAHVKDGEKCAEMLMKSGADVNATQENGETALHIAARNGQLKMVQALLAEGADPPWQSKVGETALQIAVRYCHWEVADELLRFVERNKSRLDAVMLVNLQNQEGETAVHSAAELTKTVSHHEFEDTDIMRLLLQYDGDINTHNKLTLETPLHYCARAGNADVLQEIVKHIGPNKTQIALNKQAKNGWSPLLVAAENGHLEITKILLKNNARVDVFDEHGKAALHLSAENGHEQVADVMLWHRAFVNARSKQGISPLHLSAQNGYNNLVKLLIETHGAAIDALSLGKKTPLHMGAQTGQIEVCNTLLKMKADANATDVHGQTPLHLAAENDHSDVVKLFLKHRPELVTMANTNGMTCAHIAASKGSVAVIKELMRFNKVVVTTARNKTNDSSSLHLAAAGGHTEVVRALLEAGASATDENADGMTAIHLAARHGHINVLDALKDKVSWKATSTKSGFTALHVAAHYGQIDFVREMLTRVPATVRSEPPHTNEPTVREIGHEYGLTPLHLASQSGHEGLVRLLLNSPGVAADAATTVQGSISLHLAAQSGHTAVVSLLLSKSTNQMHVKDKRGRTGLHLAAANGHLDMVSLLLGQGADIDVYDKNGWTPLHYASKAGHLPVVELLIESGAGSQHETKDGKVPICFAAAFSHTNVLSYLMKKEHNTNQLMDDQKFVFDLMQAGKMNENQSIQEFILTSPAPVETAVKMSRNFRILATKEKERARDLLSAGVYCESMATELNAIAASINSAGKLLKSVDSRGMPFLDVLIECEQKDVVSHPSVQKYLSEVWTGHLSHWAGWKMIMLFSALLFVPPVWLAFSLPLKHRFNKVPVIKFMSYLVSHIYLIVLFTLTTVYPLTPIWESYNLIPHWYEWLLLAWLSGLLVSQLTNPEDRAGLGWIKVIVIGISAIGVVVHCLAFAFTGNDRFVCLYVRNQFFAFPLMLCFVQMMDFLSFHHLFGPWAIIIRDLMKDLTRFLVILCIFMIGFTLHLSAVYQPVLAPLEPDTDRGDGLGTGGAPIETVFDTFEMLFFALFGLVEPESLPPVHRNPVWTITLSKAVFGIYLIVTLIVLINLLIAMMSDTYQRIQAQSDTEWKFGRAKLFRNMNKTSATPSPLNLFTKLFTYCKILYKHKGKVCTMNVQSYVDEEEDLDTAFDTRSMDMLAGGRDSAWLRGRRNTQVAPAGDFLKNAVSSGPVRIEDVVSWTAVVDRFMAMHGMGDGTTSMELIPTDRVEDISETGGMDIKQTNGDVVNQ